MNNVGNLTIEDIQKSLPSKKNTITQEIVDILNKSANEPEFQGESLLSSMITYENIMKKNRIGIKEYINAIKFCAYLISMEDNFTEAYKKTFADRAFVQNRMEVDTNSMQYRELTNAASRYRRNRVVIDILTLSQIPLDLMFTGARYKALGVLADTMEHARLDRDKINAAKELLAATKGPENVKMELEVGQDSATMNTQNELLRKLNDISAMQHKRLSTGENIDDVQKVNITTEFTDTEVIDG